MTLPTEQSPRQAPDAASLARSQRVKALALEVGFDLVGITGVSAPVGHARYVEQMAQGYGADMEWLKARPEVRRDVRHIHPDAKRVIMLAMSYASDEPGYLEQPPAADEGWIARYAQGRDYHYDVKRKAIALAKAISAEPSLGYESRQHRVFVDTGPILEKDFALRAGLGWIGKNTLLINRERGSWVFLASILTPLELALDHPATDHCGSCTRCLDACPTDAFAEPYVLDARKCIATWTIESVEPVRVIEPEHLGNHLFGCDICQEVCPWNRKVPTSRHTQLLPRPENVRPKLAQLEALDTAAFGERFPRSAVKRTNPSRLRSVIALIKANHLTDTDGEGDAA